MDTSRLASLVQVVILLSAVSLPAIAQAKHGPGSQVRHGLAEAADRVLREGLDAKLPSHLSTLLGLSQESEVPVKQRVWRTGTMVQGFDISVANKNDLVLFVVDEGANNQTLYLTSAQGRLRKIVSVTNGVGSVAKVTDEDKKAFEKEKEFWLGRLAPPKASK
ncbi:MAG TPA: hypothetical protein VMQ17_00365 [Candidatus Sulfotelmatobacter sp.]|nr:hypothetical protein [Candidatus Sulfotelmatobacter sp.]